MASRKQFLGEWNLFLFRTDVILGDDSLTAFHFKITLRTGLLSYKYIHKTTLKTSKYPKYE